MQENVEGVGNAATDMVGTVPPRYRTVGFPTIDELARMELSRAEDAETRGLTTPGNAT